MPNLKVEVNVKDLPQVIEQLENDAKDIEDLMVILAYQLRNDELEQRHWDTFMEILACRGYKLDGDGYVTFNGEIVDE